MSIYKFTIAMIVNLICWIYTLLLVKNIHNFICKGDGLYAGRIVSTYYFSSMNFFGDFFLVLIYIFLFPVSIVTAIILVSYKFIKSCFNEPFNEQDDILDPDPEDSFFGIRTANIIKTNYKKIGKKGFAHGCRYKMLL